MAQLAVRINSSYSEPLRKARLQIQKPEVSTYRPPTQTLEGISVGFGWKLMVGFTYLFSLITFYFVFTV